MGGADTRGRGVLEATATHPKVAAGASPKVAAGASPMVESGVSPMVESGVKVLAPTISGTSPVSQKPA